MLFCSSTSCYIYIEARFQASDAKMTSLSLTYRKVVSANDSYLSLSEGNSMLWRYYLFHIFIRVCFVLVRSSPFFVFWSLAVKPTNVCEDHRFENSSDLMWRDAMLVGGVRLEACSATLLEPDLLFPLWLNSTEKGQRVREDLSRQQHSLPLTIFSTSLPIPWLIYKVRG